MKKIVLIVVFLFVLKPILPVLDYAFNYDFIVKELCENKAKPEMKCNGKCHLMKELAKVSDAANPISQDKKSQTHHQEIEILFLEKITAFHFSPVCSWDEKKKGNTSYSDLYSQENSFSIFHPPTV